MGRRRDENRRGARIRNFSHALETQQQHPGSPWQQQHAPTTQQQQPGSPWQQRSSSPDIDILEVFPQLENFYRWQSNFTVELRYRTAFPILAVLLIITMEYGCKFADLVYKKTVIRHPRMHFQPISIPILHSNNVKLSGVKVHAIFSHVYVHCTQTVRHPRLVVAPITEMAVKRCLQGGGWGVPDVLLR